MYICNSALNNMQAVHLFKQSRTIVRKLVEDVLSQIADPR